MPPLFVDILVFDIVFIKHQIDSFVNECSKVLIVTVAISANIFEPLFFYAYVNSNSHLYTQILIVSSGDAHAVVLSVRRPLISVDTLPP